jgi:chromatin remodeling complex protein RSC6
MEPVQDLATNITTSTAIKRVFSFGVCSALNNNNSKLSKEFHFSSPSQALRFRTEEADEEAAARSKTQEAGSRKQEAGSRKQKKTTTTTRKKKKQDEARGRRSFMVGETWSICFCSSRLWLQAFAPCGSPRRA